MSGSAGGIILIPIGIALLPVVLCGLAIFGVAKAGVCAGNAAIEYEKKRRLQRELIRQSGIKESIGDFRETIQDNMNQQVLLNAEASEKMMLDLESQRNAILDAAKQNDFETFRCFGDKLKMARSQTMQEINKTQKEINNEYHTKITESMNNISGIIERQHATHLTQLQQIHADKTNHDTRVQELADIYINEAKTLISALKDDYDGIKFSASRLVTLENQLGQAVSEYNYGRFQSAIAVAMGLSVSTLEEIYKADAQKQEWENYYKLALVLSEEVKEYALSHDVITQEVKEYAEEASGKVLEDEIVGIRVSDYTEKNEAGQSRYEMLLNKVNEIHNSVRADTAEQMTTSELKEIVDILNGELYPELAICITNGIINMNNAFSRQNISEEIINFFEEHNFVFNGFAYEDDCHDKALHIGLENETSGEELIITLAPELVTGGDVQTHVEIKQIAGDETNEARKAFYRQSVNEVVTGSNPYAKVDIKCDETTINKLSPDTETKRKLKISN